MSEQARLRTHQLPPAPAGREHLGGRAGGGLGEVIFGAAGNRRAGGHPACRHKRAGGWTAGGVRNRVRWPDGMGCVMCSLSPVRPLMPRIGLSTPSFDTLSPHWVQQHDLVSGAFMEFGSRALSRWDIRITHFVISELPRTLVSIVGRALHPRKDVPDFLSVRVGASTPKFFPLTPEQTLQLLISREGRIQPSHIRLTQAEFLKRWGHACHQTLTDNNFTVSQGVITTK